MPIRYARCYAPGATVRSSDYCPIAIEDARALVADGLAELVNKNRDIRMYSRTIIKLRDRSCSWSHRLMILIGEGDRAALAMLATIAPVAAR